MSSPALSSASRQARADRQRPGLALLISLLVHGALLSLFSFGGQGMGLPGLSLPWQERRAEVPDLRVTLVPPRTPALAPLPLEPITPEQQTPPPAPDQPPAPGEMSARLDAEALLKLLRGEELKRP